MRVFAWVVSHYDVFGGVSIKEYVEVLGKNLYNGKYLVKSNNTDIIKVVNPDDVFIIE